MKGVFILLPLLLALAGCVTSVPSRDVGASVKIIGRLGQPLGKIVSIEGDAPEFKPRRTKAGPVVSAIGVQSVDGRRLARPFFLGLIFDRKSDHALTPDAKYVFTGYESGDSVWEVPSDWQHGQIVPGRFTTVFYVLEYHKAAPAKP